jgi:glycerophosphoryl diester phosphodiesterase
LSLDAGSYFADTDPFSQISKGVVTKETAASFKEEKALGRKINFFTINDPTDFVYFADLGVDGIITDFPQLFAPNH